MAKTLQEILAPIDTVIDAFMAVEAAAWRRSPLRGFQFDVPNDARVNEVVVEPDVVVESK